MTISEQELLDKVKKLRSENKIGEANALLDQYDNQNSGVSAGNQAPLEEPYTPEFDDTGVTSLLKGGLRGVAALPQAVLEGAGAVSKFLGGDTLGTGIDNLAGAIGKFRGHLGEDITASNNPNLGGVGEVLGEIAIPGGAAVKAYKLFNKGGKLRQTVDDALDLLNSNRALNKAKTEETKANTALKEQELINKPLSNEAQINYTIARTRALEDKALKAEQKFEGVKNNPNATPKQIDEAKQDLDRANAELKRANAELARQKAELARQETEYVKQQTEHYGTTVENKTNLNNAQVGNLNARTDLTRNEIAAKEESNPLKNDLLQSQTRYKDASTRKIEADTEANIKTRELTDENQRLSNELLEAEKSGIANQHTLNELRIKKLEAENRLIEHNNAINNSLTTSKTELNKANTHYKEADTRFTNLKADALEQNLGNPTGTGTTGTGGATKTAELAETVGNTAETLTPEAGVSAAENAGTGNVANTAPPTVQAREIAIAKNYKPQPFNPNEPKYNLFIAGREQPINYPTNIAARADIAQRIITQLKRLHSPSRAQSKQNVANIPKIEDNAYKVLKENYGIHAKEPGFNRKSPDQVLMRELLDYFKSHAQNNRTATPAATASVGEIETLANELTTFKPNPSPNPSPQIAKKPAINQAPNPIASVLEEFNANKPIAKVEKTPARVPATVSKPNALSNKYNYKNLDKIKTPRNIREDEVQYTNQDQLIRIKGQGPLKVYFRSYGTGEKSIERILLRPTTSEEAFNLLGSAKDVLDLTSDAAKDLLEITKTTAGRSLTEKIIENEEKLDQINKDIPYAITIIKEIINNYLKKNPGEVDVFAPIIKKIFEQDLKTSLKEVEQIEGFLGEEKALNKIKDYSEDIQEVENFIKNHAPK